MIRIERLAATGLVVAACAIAQAQTAASPAASAQPQAAAVVGNETITIQELDARALKSNMKLAQSMYDARRATLDQMILEKLLAPEAAAKGISVDEHIRKRIAERMPPITDADIENHYKANAARMGGKSLDQVTGQIRNQLVSLREKAGRDSLLNEVKEKAGVRLTLEPPRADVIIAANDPVKGPATAKVTIVEYSEFQ